ncbi:MAG: PqqD family peptide modification chaperone, partial [Candidatus Aminicenantes bacterium]|nr:PqqD family peptide modification chaperone [Candidatus Aminicenantes bacterium]
MNEFDFRINYARAREVSTCLNGDNAILYNADNGREKVINPSASLIWQKLDGGTNIEAITRSLLENYKGASHEEVQRDVCAFLGELLESKFIEAAPDGFRRFAPEEYTEIADRPGDFDISLTGKCNLHCDYCFYAHEMKDRPDLSTMEWLTFFDELGLLGVRTLTLSGGEVFVRKELFELMDYIIDKRMRFSILSNGTLI